MSCECVRIEFRVEGEGPTTTIEVYVAGTFNGENYYTWSAGGVLSASTTWTDVAGGSINGVNMFVAIASGGTIANYTLDNGTTWAATGALPASATWSSVAYGNYRFVAIASGGTASANPSLEHENELCPSPPSRFQVFNVDTDMGIKDFCSKMGITLDTSNLQNLQNLVIKSVCSEFAFISIYRETPGFGNLNSITKSIYNMIGLEDEPDKKYYLERAISYYQSLNSNSNDYKKNYAESLKIIKKSDTIVVSRKSAN